MNYVSSRIDRIDIINFIFSNTQSQFIETLLNDCVEVLINKFSSKRLSKIQIFYFHIFLIVRT
jgi:hypothetical protein